MLTREQIRNFYDRFGSLQDRQGFYEDIATRDLMAHAGFEQAKTVFEFGCGTGRFAADLLSHRLAETASLHGLRSERDYGRYRARAPGTIWCARTGAADRWGLNIAASEATFDRFVSNYVLDLLPSDDIGVLIAEALRVLTSDGRLCLVSGTHGVTPLSRFVSSAWAYVHRWRPGLVGGCRPIELLDFLDQRHWQVEYRNVVIGFGIPSEVVVGRKHC